MDRRTLTALFTAALAAGVTLAAPSDASACGGLFCSGSGSQQVNQAAERIIFKKHGDGQVTAVVQILYDGPTDRFGWVLPVPSIPEVGLSSDSAFTTLQNATNPTYTLNTTVEGDCKQPIDLCFACGAADTASAPQAEGAVNNAGGIEVLDEGSAGPYDYVVIQVDTQVDDNVQNALDWLEENNYQATNAGPDLLGPYLDDGNHLLAIRLQKSSDSGAIRPIKLTFEDTHPMVPIKLTAVAANEDMGVLAWVLGESRAIPKNYKHLELNDAYINWFNPGPTYDDVISMAANEASGQGFVTEYAQPTDRLGATIYTEMDALNWNDIAEANWEGRELELLDRLVNSYSGQPADFGPGQPAWDGYNEAIDQAFANLSMSEKDMIKQCGSCAFDGEATFPEGLTSEDLITTFDDFVVGPMRETQELIDSSEYITRLYTTMSAEEMTLDPSFDFNPDLDDVSNVHTAERIIECHRSVTRSEAPWRAELPSGLVVRGEGGSTTWPFTPGDDTEMPATISVQEVETSGPGQIVRDNIEDIRVVLDTHNAAIGTPGGCGCRTTRGSAPGGSVLLLLVGMVGLGIRRRLR
jgi:MYXO-CTERM domain-containing protein